MKKYLKSFEDKFYLEIESSFLEMMNITPETLLHLTTKGGRLIITPVRDNERATVIREITKKVMKDHDETFRKLAEN